MKVSIVHPERRTLQSIALEAPQLPKKLRPATRHELAIARGSALEFIAGIGGSKKFGGVRLLLELEPEEGETILPGCVCYSRVPSGNADQWPVYEVPSAETLASEHPHRHTIAIDLLPGVDIGIVIANPLEPLQVEGEPHE